MIAMHADLDRIALDGTTESQPYQYSDQIVATGTRGERSRRTPSQGEQGNAQTAVPEKPEGHALCVVRRMLGCGHAGVVDDGYARRETEDDKQGGVTGYVRASTYSAGRGLSRRRAGVSSVT